MLEFILDDFKGEKIHARKTCPFSAHALEFIFSYNAKQQKGIFFFSPTISSFFIEQEKHRIAYRLRKVIKNSELKNYEDLIANIAYITPLEILERPKEFIYSFKKTFPKIKLSDANIKCLDEISENITKEAIFYSEFINEVEKEYEFLLKGEEYVDHLINNQGKLFSLKFYEKIKKGITFLKCSFHNPQGILKGILLRKLYQCYGDSKNTEIYSLELSSIPNLKIKNPFE